MILGFITSFISVMFIISTSELISGDTWMIWFGCTLQGIGGFMGLCGPCCGSPTMIFYFLIWVFLGMCWWMLWICLDISNMAAQGYDGDMVGIAAQCAALFFWGLFCIYEINRYYNKIRSPHSYWCLCVNPGTKYCCCTVPCITKWISKARGDDIPDIERSQIRTVGLDIDDHHKNNYNNNNNHNNNNRNKYKDDDDDDTFK